jgi:predicted ATPase with chaperone activity
MPVNFDRLHNICGNESAKYALEIAVTGAHDIVFIGAPLSPAYDLAEITEMLWPQEYRYKMSVQWALPCRCGWHGEPGRTCYCTPKQISYWQAYHWPTYADIWVRVELPHWGSLVKWAANGYEYGERHEVIAERIKKNQAQRDQRPTPFRESPKELLEHAVKQLSLTQREVASIVEVARTVALMSGDSILDSVHIATAVQFRRPRAL